MASVAVVANDPAAADRIRPVLTGRAAVQQLTPAQMAASGAPDADVSVVFGVEFQKCLEISDVCHGARRNVIFAFPAGNRRFSMFSQPGPGFGFEPRNSRPDNEVLLLDQIDQTNENHVSVKCSKRHFLEPGDHVELGRGPEVVGGVVDSTSDPFSFALAVQGGRRIPAGFREFCQLKLCRRRAEVGRKYATLRQLAESGLNPEDFPVGSVSGFQAELAAIFVACEIVSAFVEKTRLPMYEVFKFEFPLVASEQMITAKVCLVGKCILSGKIQNALSKCSKISLQALPHAQPEVVRELDDTFKLVILCGQPFDIKRSVAEECKKRSLAFIDCGLDWKRGYLQCVVPGLSDPFDRLADDMSDAEMPPQCNIKHFPGNVDHCIEWARAKVAKLADSGSGHNGLSADEKFAKYFRAKPEKLLESFPPDEDPDFWKPPKRRPSPVAGFDPADPLHVRFVQAVSAVIDNRTNGVAIEDSLSDEATVCYARLRCRTYGISDDMVTDADIARKANDLKVCDPVHADAIACLVGREVANVLEAGSEANDWWLADIDALTLQRSMTRCAKARVGRLDLTPWDLVEVAVRRDGLLSDLLEAVKVKVGLAVSMVVMSNALVYSSAIPTHEMRKARPLSKSLKLSADIVTCIVDVSVDDCDDVIIPVRLEFGG